jgi:flagellar assembly protein FliH
MILLSNLIKSNQVLTPSEGDGQRTLTSKAIAVISSPKKLTAEETEQDEQQELLDYKKQKEILLQEIDELENRLKDTQAQIAQEKKDAEREIEAWWSEQKERANDEARRLGEEASQQGFQEGYEKGYREIQQEFEQKMKEMNEMVQLAYKEKDRIIQNAEPFLLALSVKVAERIVRQELKQHKEQLLGIIQSGLQQAVERGEIIIEVSPYDYSFILSQLGELEPYIISGSELKIIPEQAHAATGRCMIHTSNGSYDVSIDSQLSEIKKQLMAYYEERATE